MLEQADGRYGYRAWDRRPGDSVDPSTALTPIETVYSVMGTAPTPLPADVNQPRLLGVERTQPGIVEVLGVGPVPLMQDTETRQDSGMQGTSRDSMGAW